MLLTGAKDVSIVLATESHKGVLLRVRCGGLYVGESSVRGSAGSSEDPGGAPGLRGSGVEAVGPRVCYLPGDHVEQRQTTSRQGANISLLGTSVGAADKADI